MVRSSHNSRHPLYLCSRRQYCTGAASTSLHGPRLYMHACMHACGIRQVRAHILQPPAAACGRGREPLVKAIQVGAGSLSLLKRLFWRGSPQPRAQKGLHLLNRQCLALAAVPPPERCPS